MNAKDSRCDSVSPQVPGTSLYSEPNESVQGRVISLTTEASAVDGLSAVVSSNEQHCDVKVDVHRKSSSASSEPAIVVLEPDKSSRQSVAKSKVILYLAV